MNIEKLLDSSQYGIENKSTHQVCNIKIREVTKYWNHLEGENVSLTKRLQHQISLNDDLEKENILIDSKLTNKINESDILKTCLRQNTEITKELQKILGSTSSTLDLSKTNNKNLSKKLKKYKKLLKHKEQELISISHFGMGESMVNDLGLMFKTGETSRPMSCSSNIPRFSSTSGALQNPVNNQQIQSNYM